MGTKKRISKTAPRRVTKTGPKAAAKFQEKVKFEKKSGKSTKFLQLVYNMLEAEAQPDAVKWSIAGDSIIVTDKKALAKLLPKHFGALTYPSFRRQLNLYGFTRVKGKSNLYETRHPLFKRSEPGLLQQIRRQETGAEVPLTQEQLEQKAMIEQNNKLEQETTELEKRIEMVKSANEKLIASNKLALRQLDERQKDNELRIRKFLYLVLTRMQNRMPNYVKNAQQFFIEEGMLTKEENFPKSAFDERSFGMFIEFCQKASDPSDTQHDFLDRWMGIYLKDLDILFEEKIRLEKAGKPLPGPPEGDIFAETPQKAYAILKYLVELYVNVVRKDQASIKWEDVTRNMITYSPSHGLLMEPRSTADNAPESVDELSIIMMELEKQYESF